MESFRAWLQDWSDACEYAKECAPDLSVLAGHEPYTALASIAAVCFVLWWWNEKAIARLLESETKYRPVAAPSPAGVLKRVLTELQEMPQQRRAAA